MQPSVGKGQTAGSGISRGTAIAAKSSPTSQHSTGCAAHDAHAVWRAHLQQLVQVLLLGRQALQLGPAEVGHRHLEGRQALNDSSWLVLGGRGERSRGSSGGGQPEKTACAKQQSEDVARLCGPTPINTACGSPAASRGRPGSASARWCGPAARTARSTSEQGERGTASLVALAGLERVPAVQ